MSVLTRVLLFSRRFRWGDEPLGEHEERRKVSLTTSLSIALVLVSSCAARGDEHEGDAGEHRVAAHTVTGKISAIAWSRHKFTIDVANGLVTLEVDRNTAVFLDDRLGSLGDLVVGTPVRASFGSDQRAVWVEARSHGAGAPGGPLDDAGVDLADGVRGAGTDAGPPVLPAPALDISSADGGHPDGGGTPRPPPTSPEAGAPSHPPGNVPAGPPPPEPKPGMTPPPRQPRPAGPSPIPGGAQG